MTTLTFSQIKDLWTANGGNPNVAPVMAAIALAESGGRTDAANTRPPDASYGLWQINYYGSLARGRTAAYGSPTELVADPNRQAKAAIAISGNGQNMTPWTTYTSGAYRAPLAAAGGSLPALPAIAGVASQGASVPSGAVSPDNEGYLIDLTMPSAIPNIRVSRSVVRKMLGATVLVGGGVVALAGVFVLVGGKAPGPAGVVQTALRQQGQTRRTRTREAGLSERQERRSTVAAERDDLAARRRARQARAEGETRSARAAGEQAAEEAGPF